MQFEEASVTSWGILGSEFNTVITIMRSLGVPNQREKNYRGVSSSTTIMAGRSSSTSQVYSYVSRMLACCARVLN